MLTGDEAGIKNVTIEVEGPAAMWTATAGAQAAAAGSRLRVPIRDLGEVPAIVHALVVAGAHIVRVTPDRRSLEDVYLELVGAPS